MKGVVDRQRGSPRQLLGEVELVQPIASRGAGEERDGAEDPILGHERDHDERSWARLADHAAELLALHDAVEIARLEIGHERHLAAVERGLGEVRTAAIEPLLFDSYRRALPDDHRQPARSGRLLVDDVNDAAAPEGLHSELGDGPEGLLVVNRGGEHVRGLHEEPLPLLGSLAVGDVAEDDREDHPAIDLQLGYRGLGGELFSALPPAEDLAPLAHLARSLRRRGETLDVPGVSAPEAQRQEDLDGLAHDLVLAVAEDLLGSFVEEGDALALVDGDDPVDGDRDDAAQRGLRALPGRLGAPAKGDVDTKGNLVIDALGPDPGQHAPDDPALLAASGGIRPLRLLTEGGPERRSTAHGASRLVWSHEEIQRALAPDLLEGAAGERRAGRVPGHDMTFGVDDHERRGDRVEQGEFQVHERLRHPRRTRVSVDSTLLPQRRKIK